MFSHRSGGSFEVEYGQVASQGKTEGSPAAGGAYVPAVFVATYAPFGRCRHTILPLAKTEASFQK